MTRGAVRICADTRPSRYTPPRPRRLAELLMMCSLCIGPSCAGISAPIDPKSTHWNYHVRVDETHSRLQVTLCVAGAWTGDLIPGDPRRKEMISAPIVVGDDVALKPSLRGYHVHDLAPNTCIAYGVPLQGGGSPQHVRPEHATQMIRTSEWLWRPARFPEHFDAGVEFELPSEWRVSVPWPQATEMSPYPAYLLDHSAFRWTSFAALGPLQLDRFKAENTVVELTVLGKLTNTTPEGLRGWIRDAFASVRQLSPSLLPSMLQVIVVPVDGHAHPVVFGLATRGGGAGVVLYIDREARGRALLGEWTMTHELLHHTMPFIDDAWMAEGWTSYYTEVLRTRAGHRSEEAGWQALYDAFQRGRATSVGGLDLRTASARMHQHSGYARVYWAGAAIALAIDVALRTTSTSSLDDAIVELARCCRVDRDRAHARELLEHLDRWHPSNIFTDTAQRTLEETDFPSVEESLAMLGITIRDGHVELDHTHPHAIHRQAIMAPR